MFLFISDFVKVEDNCEFRLKFGGAILLTMMRENEAYLNLKFSSFIGIGFIELVRPLIMALYENEFKISMLTKTRKIEFDKKTKEVLCRENVPFSELDWGVYGYVDLVCCHGIKKRFSGGLIKNIIIFEDDLILRWKGSDYIIHVGLRNYHARKIPLKKEMNLLDVQKYGDNFTLCYSDGKYLTCQHYFDGFCFNFHFPINKCGFLAQNTSSFWHRENQLRKLAGLPYVSFEPGKLIIQHSFDSVDCAIHDVLKGDILSELSKFVPCCIADHIVSYL